MLIRAPTEVSYRSENRPGGSASFGKRPDGLDELSCEAAGRETLRTPAQIPSELRLLRLAGQHGIDLSHRILNVVVT